MQGNPLETIKNLDEKFFADITEHGGRTFAEGALSAKMKYLMAMVLDASHGAAGGVTSLASQALKHGATKEEIMEALQVANYISGVGSVYTASFGLKELF